jgi:hypothetical protein
VYQIIGLGICEFFSHWLAGASVDQTQVTDAGVAALRKAKPEIKVSIE